MGRLVVLRVVVAVLGGAWGRILVRRPKYRDVEGMTFLYLEVRYLLFTNNDEPGEWKVLELKGKFD